jgi:antitoxin VapB
VGIFIKNPETEKAVRAIAALRGTSITSAIDDLAREALEREQSRPGPRRKNSLEDMRAATETFRRESGLDRQSSTPLSKDVWDVLWPTGIREIDRS